MISVWSALLIFGCGYICRLAQEILKEGGKAEWK